MTYLNTELSPDEYYKVHADEYQNPHRRAIRVILDRLGSRVFGHVLDLGCGHGLATDLLIGWRGLTFEGVDRESAMTGRYTKGTGWKASARSFWDEMPKCQSVVACYSMHLCPKSRLHEAWWRIAESGAIRVLVITPIKDRPGLPPHAYTELDRMSAKVPGKEKRIYGYAYGL